MSGYCRSDHLVGWKEELDIIKAHVNFALPDPTKSGSQEWRSLPELPTGQELNPDLVAERDAILARLPHNDVASPYPSKERYLETHYRLQREEGITMLRFAIKEYKDNPKMDDTENTCVYTKVFVRGYSMTRQGALCRIQFSTERAGKKIRWTHTRRLTPGTLVAISTASDNFSTICKPAIIADRSIEKGLELNPSEIQLHWANIGDSVMDANEELVMVEARRGYFESVRHCLVGLQHVAATDTPFDKYLVEGSHADQTAGYVLDSPQMNLTPLLHHVPQRDADRERLLSEYRSYDILGGIPTVFGQHTSLDNSQLEAVHRILTKEMAIVQGPPGTGKTFTSVQALSALVETHNAGGYQGEVIVVAAETNHAVDQILTQLHKLQHNILRLGSRTRDEDIKKFNMHNYRRRLRRAKDKDQESLERAERDATTKFHNLVQEVFPKELLDFQVLREHDIITEEQLNSIFDGNVWTWHAPPSHPPGVMSEWLGRCLIDLSISRQRDPIFDSEEVPEEDDIDGAGFDHDLDDPAFYDADEQGRDTKAFWVDIGVGKWGGSNLRGYKETNFLFRRELRRPNLWEIHEDFRGAIYEYWRKQLISRRYNDFYALLANHARKVKNLKIHRWIRDVQCIRSNRISIVGCTTTGLCKFRGLLAALKPKTILIEEAAQSREANIASALYPGLQQLILVGDDQQLVPQTDTPGLSGVPYNLSVSMFERLVRYLNIPFTVLNMQRRMIPSIREILNPFYPSLGDHPVVRDPTHRPPIPGMPVASYLFHHIWPEGMDTESLSKYNMQEAEMVVRFVSYLIANEVPAEKITILTFYRGQRKKILQIGRRILPNIGVVHLNVFTVDSYQGEENDIIILSLVRSNRPNTPGRAGFVEDMNRGVVSISRARRGFFIFGNITNLENATVTSAFMWGSVRQVMERQGHFNPFREGLPIRCQNHGTINYIDGPDAFADNLGGCWERCMARFEDCGHVCGRFCHAWPHSKFVCQEPCNRPLRCGHGCSEVCGDECKCSRGCAAFSGQMLPPIQRLSSNQNAKGRSGNTGNNGRGYDHPRDVIRPNTGRNENHIATNQDLTQVNGSVQHNLVPGYAWATFDAASDDARRRQAAQASSTLVDSEDQSFQDNEPAAIRDEFRPVTLGTEGKRKVGGGVVIDTSPDKTMDTPGKLQSTPNPLASPAIHGGNGVSMPLRSRQGTAQSNSTLAHNGGGARGSQPRAQAQVDGSANSPSNGGDGIGPRAYRGATDSRARGGGSQPTSHSQLQPSNAPVDTREVLSSYTQRAEWETSTVASDESADARLGELSPVDAADDEDVKDLIQF